MNATVEISVGELIDKYSILCIKELYIRDGDKLQNVYEEKRKLAETCVPLLQNNKLNLLFLDLYSVNKKLWEIEDKIRKEEKDMNFGENFVALARDVYHTNDHRFDLKSKINNLMGSEIIEEKSYEEY